MCMLLVVLRRGLWNGHFYQAVGRVDVIFLSVVAAFQRRSGYSDADGRINPVTGCGRRQWQDPKIGAA